MHAASLAAQFLDNRPTPRFDRPRLLIDVSHIAAHDHGTGIQRVVRETVKAAYCTERPGFKAVAVELVGTELVEARGWLDRQGLLLPFEANEADNRPLIPRPGDHLLMLDSSWARYAEFEPAFARARAARVPVTTAVFDLLPLTLPPGNFPDGGREWFEAWLKRAIKSSDNFVCISKSVADDLIALIKRTGIAQRRAKVGYWHLGADIPARSDCPADSPVRRVPEPFVLMVGTLEPRKNHSLALDAFERLWNQSSELSLVIAGRSGWLIEHLVKRIAGHNLRNKKLYFFEQPTDNEIAYLYRKAAALFVPSKGEGFGLPLVEAAHHGTPIICADIPVFREIAQGHATYVNIDDPEVLVVQLTDWQKADTRHPSNEMPRMTWIQSVDALLDVLLENRWYWQQRCS